MTFCKSFLDLTEPRYVIEDVLFCQDGLFGVHLAKFPTYVDYQARLQLRRKTYALSTFWFNQDGWSRPVITTRDFSGGTC